MDVTGAPDLFANRIARGIAPVRLTGNYGQEILYGSVAFKPASLDKGIFEKGFGALVDGAARTYARELDGHRRSFISFKQVPWHHYSRLAVELSQLTLRSPFLDNDLVGLTFRTPPELAAAVDMQLRLIAEGNAALGRIGTDRGLLHRPIPLLTTVRHAAQEFTFKAEYAYDYGMPQWLARLDHLFSKVHLERLFLGRHKVFHFRVWYRDVLSRYLREMLLDSRTLSRPYLEPSRLEAIVRGHLKGDRNYTTTIHKVLTLELVHRLFLDPK
jgi:asparagine synthase (glutamine-hydrolysing)